jgi:hypothetical protein
MPTSKFKIYTANDIQGPGLITGGTGSLITILDYCLVGGYGTGSYYKSPAGWTKPFPNSGSTSTTPAFGCWRQGGGSSMSLFMNDCGGMSAAQGKEAWITGWEQITSVAPTGTGSIHVGQGWNQFPLPSQELTYGYSVVRKADNTDTTGTGSRYWIIAADETTMYMWIWSEGDDLNRCHHWMFGDIYSLAGASDLWKCSIYGRVINNDGFGTMLPSSNVKRDYTELISAGPWLNIVGQYLTVGQPGHYLARTGYGTGTSLNYTKKGDSQYGPGETAIYYGINPNGVAMYGVMQPVNGADNQSYIVPLEVIEPSSAYVRKRGRLRGLYHTLTHYTNYQNGQIIVGSGIYAGKSFMAIRYSYVGSCWLLDISDTVETN